MAAKTRCGPFITYSRTSCLAPMADPGTARPEAPHAESVRQWPGHFNVETARLGAGAPSFAKGKRPSENELQSTDADVLFPYGHIPRVDAKRDAVSILSARGGIGEARRGDKPYHRVEWSDSFAGTAKPTKWFADPGAPRLAWTAGRPGVDSAVAGRPLWARPN